MALFVAKSGQLQTVKGIMNVQLQEIKNMYIKNRLTVEGDIEPETHTGLQQIYQNKLIEGVDYDVYTYLKGTGDCYIDTLINPAWNDQLSATTEASGRPTVVNPCILDATGTNIRIGMVLGGAWYKDNITQFLVLNKAAKSEGYIAWERFPANAELYASFKVVNNSIPTVSFKVNGASWTNRITTGSNIITELPDTTYKIGQSKFRGLDVLKLKNIKINSHNFIPCQLIKSIPATLDANNIARSAGECGMIDLISGKFYGNVANSGTFTVENDNE